MPACLLLSVFFGACGTSPGCGFPSEATVAPLALRTEPGELAGGFAYSVDPGEFVREPE